MPPRKGGLGRGLDAILGAPPVLDDADGVPSVGVSDAPLAPLEVELGRIEPNPQQPRRGMHEAQLEELASSIKEHGIIQPLLVQRMDTDGSGGPVRYQLIAGERRWQAARLAGLMRVPVVVRDASPREMLELALVENVQRADLNSLEEALAYQQLASEFGLTQDEIGRRVGKSRFAVANTLRLLQLPASVQQAVADGALSEGHARAILGLKDKEAQRQLAEQVIQQDWSVRQTEEAIRRTQQAALARRSPGPSAEVADLETRFREALGTRVNLTRSKRGGRLVIHYYDDEQLQGIYERLSGGTE